jgi:hypothetical protein
MGFSSTFMPEAFAENEHLYVSAEVEGSFAKGQVVEIVVAEAGISELDTAYGMPDVSVNGSSLYMAQAIDGAWYAYIVDGDFSDQIDAKYPNHDGDGSGADYGIPEDEQDPDLRHVRNIKKPWSAVRTTKNFLWERISVLLCNS